MILKRIENFVEYNFNEIILGLKNRKYELIGSGSSRKVYDLMDGCVIKVAKDIRGIYQNQVEYTVYQSRKSNFFAKVVAISEDNKCLIMSKAVKIKNIYTVYKYYNVRNIKSLTVLDHFNEDIKKNKLSIADLTRPSSWGFVGDKPVLIDYGLNSGIFKKFYGLNTLLKRYRVLKY